MKPEQNSKRLLGVSRSKAKMVEFSIPAEHHITITRDPAGLLPLTIGILGDLAAQMARGEASGEVLANSKQDLRFSACFFDSYLNAASPSQEKDYLSLLGSAAYYLSDLPGSSMVLVNRVSGTFFDTETRDLDRTLFWLLKGRFDTLFDVNPGIYAGYISEGIKAVQTFYSRGLPTDHIAKPFLELRSLAYAIGSPRELFLADLIVAVVRRRVEVSSRQCLPRFSGLEPSLWEKALGKKTFVRELWPAQRLLGESGVFRGLSAVVQMPTSAGKTKATEVLIRSAFLSGRTNLTVMIAPFRALCHEIRDSMLVAFKGEDIQVDELSDVPEDDFDFSAIVDVPQVLILTPEKLLYILRQQPDIAPRIGLLIFDEGHQFDTGVRGVTYELLVSALKRQVPQTCQIILISAVITNAEAINGWLNGEPGVIVKGSDLHPNLRSVAFASWLDSLGRLEYLGQADADNQMFFVPRVIESQTLRKLSNRERTRQFPERKDGQSVALYLALKLVPQGSVAVFCGLKGSVAKMCKMLADAYERNLSLPTPLDYSDASEVRKLAGLVKRHLGDDNPIVDCAEMGVFTHHGSTPTGIRLAVEYAMKESLIKVVICTSTLAQGVNLPIKYLIVTGVYQGRRPISVRDFQNLIGRAGRSGMHTEGSIIFADPELFDDRNRAEGRRRWAEVERLLDPSKAEACASNLLQLFEPLHDDKNAVSLSLNVREFFQALIAHQNGLDGFIADMMVELRVGIFSAKGLRTQLEPRVKTIEAIESYIMAATGQADVPLTEDMVLELARGTLAYHLANPQQRADLEHIFTTLSKNVAAKVPDTKIQKIYSQALFGVRTSLEIHTWLSQNREALERTGDDHGLLGALWPAIVLGITNSKFKTFNKPELLFGVAVKWIDGATFGEILGFLKEAGAKFGSRLPQIDQVVELCENAFAFEGVLVLAAISGLLREEGINTELVERIERLQKRLKYGLASSSAIVVYELGFADRVLAVDLAAVIELETNIWNLVRAGLLTAQEQVGQILANAPGYYTFVWQTIVDND